MEDPRIYHYTGYTLVDITNTNVTSFTFEQEKQRNQQRNWETIQQILGLRTQVLSLTQTQLGSQSMKKFEFGDNYRGQQSVWQFDFEIEFADLYKQGDDQFRILKDDFAQAPVVMGLDESVKPSVNILYTDGPDKNIYFKIIDNR